MAVCSLPLQEFDRWDGLFEPERIHGLQRRALVCHVLPYVYLINRTEDMLEEVHQAALEEENEETVVSSRARRSRRLAAISREAPPRHLNLELHVRQYLERLVFSETNPF